MSDDKPVRQDVRGKGYWYSDTIRKCPTGFIEKLTGLPISWMDEPLQYIIKVLAVVPTCNHFWKMVTKDYYKCSWCDLKHYR